MDRSVLLRLEADGDVAIVTTRPGGDVVGWNPGAERLLGFRPDDIVGRNVSALCPLSEAVCRAGGRCVVGEAGTGFRDSDGWLRRGDGTLMWANLVSVALQSGGESRGFALLVRDAGDGRRTR